ncbi:MAG: hypothetical protein ACLPJJ_08050 [Acidocella sp.]|uniref:hypothetical protein n=1 Tax=Acidocella sp. TaxID=50710 RepID=UPI003FD7CF5E
MAKKPSGGDGKKTENPPPKTSPKVKKEAGKEMKAGATAAERSVAASVMRHIEPRKTPNNKPSKPGSK